MRSFAKSAVIAIALVACAPAVADQGPAREINITSDSQPGWTPTIELEAQAEATVERFWTAVTSERTDDAYALAGPGLTEGMTKAQFKQHAADSLAKTGKPLDVRFVKVTWTKDSPRAPEPGLYVAIDIEAKFERASRYCGYIVLHQKAPNAAFTVSRQQTAFLDDATAKSIEATQSRAAVDGIWSQMIEGCPNYAGIFAGMPRLPESTEGGIGYPSVAAALADLRSRKGMKFRTERGWTIAEDAATMTIWSFAPQGHPAYPAAVKRWIENAPGGAVLNMNVSCEASKSACDDLVREFQRMNGGALR
jgi:hypothetical protein